MQSTAAACAAATVAIWAAIAARAAAAAAAQVATEARTAATTVRAAASEAGAGSRSSRCGGHIGMGRRGMDSARGASGGSGCGCSGGGGCCTGGSCIPRTVRAAVAGAAPLQHPCAASGVSSPGHFGSNRAHGEVWPSAETLGHLRCQVYLSCSRPNQPTAIRVPPSHPRLTSLSQGIVLHPSGASKLKLGVGGPVLLLRRAW